VGTPGAVDVIVTTPGGTSVAVAADRFTYLAAPTVTAVSPGAGPLAGGHTITITGTAFTLPATVSFGRAAASNVVVVNASTLTAIVPAGAGTVDVTVTTNGGTSASSAADQFTYLGVPAVTGVSPRLSRMSGRTPVTITGANFASPVTVHFGLASASNVRVVDTGTITATSPAGTSAVDVTVTTAGGKSATSSADLYTYLPLPTLAQVSPTSGPTAGGIAVTITGTSFAGPASVSFGGMAASNVLVRSSTTITASSPPGAPGSVNVFVTTAGGTSGAVAADRFTYLAVPTVTAVSPSAGPLAGGTSVTITGTAFAPPATVSFGGVAASNVVVKNGSRITATAPAGSGTVDVTVTTNGGTSVTSAADRFTYLAAPTLTEVSPNIGPTSGGTSVAISGANFVSPATVHFGPALASNVNVMGDGSITATSPAGTGFVDVTVTTPGGTSATSAADVYTYLPVPTVTQVSPASGLTTGGTAVTITGSNFAAPASVSFGDAAASDVAVNDATTITATSPPGALGSVDVIVTTPGGTSSPVAGDQFTYVETLALTPTAASPGSSVTAAIAGFSSGETVQLVFNGADIASCVVAANGTCSARFSVRSNTVPGTYTVTANGSNGDSAAATFTVTGTLSLSVSYRASGWYANVFVSGFAGGEPIAFSFNQTSVGSCTAYPGGTCVIDFVVASEPAGPYIVTATGESSGIFASATFPEPLLALSPHSGAPGSLSTAIAGWFSAYEEVTITYDGAFIGSCTTDSTGSCTLPFVVPAGAPYATYEVTATGQTSQRSTTSFFEVIIPSIDLNPSSGGPGTSVTAYMGGFPIFDALIEITYGGVTIGSFEAATDGEAYAEFSVPAGNPSGTYLVVATGQTSGYVATTTFDQNVGVLTLSPSSGSPGASTIASASGFASGESIQFAFDGTPVGTCTADASGSCTSQATAPANDFGPSDNVTATGAVSGVVATATFQIIPTLTLSPSSGGPGASVVAVVSGFGTDDWILITYGGVQVDGWCNVFAGYCTMSFTVPAGLAAGTIQVTATGQNSGLSASAPFTQNVASLALSPSSGGPGSTVTAMASGFDAGETVNISYWYGGPQVASCTTDANGACSPSFSVPPEGTGDYPVHAAGLTSGLWAEAWFNQNLGLLTLSPSSGGAGACTSASVSGFGYAEKIQFAFDGTALGSCTTDANGSCTSQITVPVVGPAGSYIVTATGADSGITASATFQVVPTLSISPSSGGPGSSVSVVGGSFHAGEQVLLSYGGISLASCTADASGSFTTSFTVPPDNPAGPYVVDANGQHAQFVQEAASLLLNPDSGESGSASTALARGFAAAEAVEITFAGLQVGSCTTDAIGSCSASFTVPTNNPNSTCTLAATGLTSGLGASATFVESTPLLTLSPSFGAPGASASVSAIGFASGELVQFAFNGVSLGSCVADATGSCASQTTVPDGGPGGSYSVTATGASSGLIASTTFQVMPTIALNPSSGGPGSSVSAIASGFGAGEHVAITYSGLSTGDCVTDAGGSCTTSFTVPAIDPAGAWEVGGAGQTSQMCASAPFTQNVASLVLSPSDGGPGTAVTVIAGDFSAGETVELTFSGIQVASCTANAVGFCAAMFNTPMGEPNGNYPVAASGLASGLGATTSFSQDARVVLLSPSGASSGASVSASVLGYQSGETVTFRFFGKGQTVGSCVADSTGACTGQITVPSGYSAGSYDVTARDTSGDSAYTTFQVVQALALNPSAGSPGSSTIATASGFAYYENVTITYGSVLMGSCNAGATSSCSLSFSVPNGYPSGMYEVTATGDSSGLAASEPFSQQ
jgi:hypothetical protein